MAIKKDIDKIDKKDHIITVAERLFSDFGFASTSTRMLAKEAEVNLGMLAYYFSSKEAILEAIIEKNIGFYHTNFERIRLHATSNMQMMEAIIDMYAEHMMNNRKFHKIMHSEVFGNQMFKMEDVKLKMIEKNANYISSIIEDGIKAGEFRKIDARMFFTSIIGTIIIFIKNENFSKRMLQLDIEQPISSQENRERLKMYLRDYLKTYLSK